jgi:NTP pyrophosphatase (non-canonical NTP hydrolase)
MTEDEAISILEEELASASDWLARARHGETKDGATPARIYEALSALSEAWAAIIFVPKRAVLALMQVDDALCAYDPQSEAPENLPDSLGDLLIHVEEVLVGNDADRQHLTQLTFGQDPRTVEWGPNSGLQDETLWRVFDFLTGEDGVMFDGPVVLPLTEANCDYARSVFRELVEKHGPSQRVPRLLAGWHIHLRGHLVTWRRSPASSIRQAELADELLDLVFQYLSGANTLRDSGYEQLTWAWPEDYDQAH